MKFANNKRLGLFDVGDMWLQGNAGRARSLVYSRRCNPYDSFP